MAKKNETKYSSKFVEQVKRIILDMSPLNSRGGLAFGKIAKILGVSVSTLRQWRTVGGKYYIAEFAGAITESEKMLMENIDLGKINAGVIKRAQGYKKVKKTKEPVVEGPAMPAFSKYTKPLLIEYAKTILKMRIDKKLKKADIELKIKAKVAELTVEKMKVTKIEEEFVPSDINAAKYANQNLGVKDKRWVDKQISEHGFNEETAKLLDMIDGKTKGTLPNRKESEEISE